jgi:hypothetical protein
MYQLWLIYFALLHLARKSDSRAAGLSDKAELSTQTAPSATWQDQAAIITAAPSEHLVDLRKRQFGDSICGYWTDGGECKSMWLHASTKLSATVHEVSCPYGIPCATYTPYIPEMVYCSNYGQGITTLGVDYTAWQFDGEGSCPAGWLCW